MSYTREISQTIVGPDFKMTLTPQKGSDSVLITDKYNCKFVVPGACVGLFIAALEDVAKSIPFSLNSNSETLKKVTRLEPRTFKESNIPSMSFRNRVYFEPGADSQKIRAIKTIRTFTNLVLRDAKEVSESKWSIDISHLPSAMFENFMSEMQRYGYFSHCEYV